MKMLPSFFSALLFSYLSVVVQAACYYPNGSIAPNDTPCRDDTAESACCGQGYACLSNGMCQATGQELQKGGATELVRGACTDRSWRSSGCPLFCINPETDNVAGGIGVAKCLDTVEELYYCINSVQDQVNCTAKRNVLFFQQSATAITTIGVIQTTTESSSTTSTVSQETQVTNSPSQAPSAPTMNPSRLPSSNPVITSTGAPHSPTSSPDTEAAPPNDRAVTIGAAVGASAGLLLLGGLGIWLFFHMRRRRRAREQITQDLGHAVDARSFQHEVYEAPSEWKTPPGQNQPHELPGWEGYRR